MTLDLTLLVWSVALAFLLVVIAVLGATGQVGLPSLAGNRDDASNVEGWAGRAKRAHLNMMESLPLFAILILVSHVAGRTDGMTLLGAQLFFWGRVAHAAIYIAGVPWLRTLAWAVAVLGMILVFLPLI